MRSSETRPYLTDSALSINLAKSRCSKLDLAKAATSPATPTATAAECQVSELGKMGISNARRRYLFKSLFQPPPRIFQPF